LLHPEQAKSGYTFWYRKLIEGDGYNFQHLSGTENFSAMFRTNVAGKTVRGGKVRRLHLTVDCKNNSCTAAAGAAAAAAEAEAAASLGMTKELLLLLLPIPQSNPATGQAKR
jgi:hypothetical protein